MNTPARAKLRTVVFSHLAYAAPQPYRVRVISLEHRKKWKSWAVKLSGATQLAHSGHGRTCLPGSPVTATFPNKTALSFQWGAGCSYQPAHPQRPAHHSCVSDCDAGSPSRGAGEVSRSRGDWESQHSPPGGPAEGEGGREPRVFCKSLLTPPCVPVDHKRPEMGEGTRQLLRLCYR